MSEVDNSALDPLLPAQCDISEEDRSDHDREPEGCEPPAPDPDQAGPSARAAKSRPPPDGLSSNLSFFDDYDIVDGIPRTTPDVGDAYFDPIRFSRNGLKVAVRDFNCTCLSVFDLFGRGQKVVIKVEGWKIEDFCFEGDSEDVLLCIDHCGTLTKWKSQEGDWKKVLEFAGPWSFGESPKFLFSNSGQYMSLWSEMEGKCSIACYDIWHVPHSVKKVKEAVLDIQGRYANIQYSPDECDLFFTGMNQSPAVVWADFTSRDTRFKLKGGHARWFGDRIIVTVDSERSYLWKIDKQSGGQSPLSDKSLLVEKEAYMEFSGEILGVCGDKALEYFGDEIIVWDLTTSSISGRVKCSLLVEYFCPLADGKRFAVFEAGGKLAIWDAEHFVRIWETLESGAGHLHCPGGNKLVYARSHYMGQRGFYVFHFDGLEGEDELVRDTADPIKLDECMFSCDGSRIGALDCWGNVLIWNLCDDNTIQLVMEGTAIAAFCFSVDGTRMVTLSMNWQIALWNVEGRSGVVADCSKLCNIKELIQEDSVIPAMSFTKNGEGQDVVAILTKKNARFTWIDMEGNAFFTVDLNVRTLFGHRFSVNCEQCVVVMEKRGTLVCEVWDLVARRKITGSENVFDGRVLGDLLSDQVAMDGSKLLIRNYKSQEPILMVSHKLEDIGDHALSILGSDKLLASTGYCPTATLSEDGQHFATCVRIDGLHRRVTVQHAGQDAASSVPFRIIDFNGDEADGRLLMSCNGQCIAWVTNRKVRVWSPHSDNGCTPSYERLKMRNQASDRAVLTSLLYTSGKNLLTFPNGAGWTFLARAIEDGNTEWVRAIIEWAKSNEECLLLNRGHVDMEEGEKWTNLLELALSARLPECIQVLLNGTLDGALVCRGKDEILAKSLQDISRVYPRIVVDTLGDSRLLHKNGDTWYSQQAFERKPFVVRTSDERSPEDLEDFWSSHIHSLIKPNLLGILKKLSFGHNEEMGGEDAKKVPANAYVIPVSNFAQVGTEGLLSKALSMGKGEKVFTALPMQAMVHYKWDAYGRELVFANMFYYVLLLGCFTLYSLLIGVGCRDLGGLSSGFEFASGLLLVLSMVMSAFGLYGELKQLVAYWKEVRGFWFYWVGSKWNALEFLTYVLIVVVIPTFHFGSNPCKLCWGISWGVPLVDVLLWWKVLYFAQTFPSTGPMVLMIFAIITDILFFLFIGFGVLVGFGMGFFVLFREDGEGIFGTFGKSMLTMFGMMLGDFDLDILHKSHAPTMAISLFVAYMLVMAIVLLNLLIAIMGDSFDRIKESEEQHFVMVKASIIDDMETMLSADQRQKIKQGIGEYLHVLLPKDHIEEVGEWQGRMLDLKKHFENTILKSEARQQERVDDLARKVEHRLDNVEARLQERVDDLEAKIDKSLAQKDRIGSLEDTMKTILDKVETAMVGGRVAATCEAE